MADTKEARLKLLSEWKNKNRRRSVSTERSTTPTNGAKELKKSNANNKRQSRTRKTKENLTSTAVIVEPSVGLVCLNTAPITPPLSEKEVSLEVAIPSLAYSSPKKASSEGKENQMGAAVTLMDIEVSTESVSRAIQVVSPINNNNPESSAERKPIDGKLPPKVVKQESPPLIDEEFPSDLPYSTGDVVWAYISGFPLWPSLISVDPTENKFTKTKSNVFFFTFLCLIVFINF